MKIKCEDSYKVAKDNIDGESAIFIYSNLKVSTMQFHIALNIHHNVYIGGHVFRF